VPTTLTPDGLMLHTLGDGPPVLWIHGYTMDSTLWYPLWNLLPGWRHVGVDLPGHGGSARLRPGQTLPGLATALAAVAREQGCSRVVALSFGSAVALQLAVDEPALVRRLVLGAPAISGGPAEPGADDRYRQLIMLRRVGVRAGLPDLGERLADLWMQSPPDIFKGTLDHPRVRAGLHAVIVAHRWDELTDGAMALLSRHRQTVDDLRRISAATLVFSGDEDMPTSVRNAAILHEVVPDCRLVGLPGAGHLCLLERPADVAGLIAAHLR
jgi:pimeloyl-ACP methyl ester carboxylesterase